jgi:hypothetical protein
MDSSNVCPNCGSLDREYSCTEYDDNYEGFIYKCTECGCEYIEWYVMKYDSTEVLRNGNIHSDAESEN